MSIEGAYIWMDGEFVPSMTRKYILSHSLHYGLGVFEEHSFFDSPAAAASSSSMSTFGVCWTPPRCAVWMCSTHWRSFVRPVSPRSRRTRFSSAYIRPLVHLGMEGMGLGARNNPVHTSVIVWKWGAYLGDDGISNGIRVATGSFTRHHVNAGLQRRDHGSLRELDHGAVQERSDNGYDEAIMLDHSGYVAEGTSENLFIMRDGVVKTPPIVNILGGITPEDGHPDHEHEGLKVHRDHLRAGRALRRG